MRYNIMIELVVFISLVLVLTSVLFGYLQRRPSSTQSKNSIFITKIH